jgi:hypothetical protein
LARAPAASLAAVLAAAAVLAGCAAPAAQPRAAAGGGWSPRDKVVALNLAGASVALGWGVWSWEWGESGPRLQDEGWFGRATTEGGADKLGHAWTGYALGHLFSRQYERWGHAEAEAARMGALSSFGIMGLVEVGDAFSDVYGFSVQDFLFNTVGAGAAWLLWRDDDLARKLDFRVEYDPFAAGDHQVDAFTDYDRLRYLLALKAEGFAAIENPLLRNLELHLGYYARGYSDAGPAGGADPRRRNLYVGVGLNLSRLLSPHLPENPGTDVLHYVQLPYAYVPVTVARD